MCVRVYVNNNNGDDDVKHDNMIVIIITMRERCMCKLCVYGSRYS